jgi:hypothetical protein
VPARPNRLATGRRILSVEPGASLRNRAEFLAVDMDPRDIDGLRVEYDAMDSDPGILERGDTIALCHGLEILRLTVEDPATRRFLRGDLDESGRQDLSDAIRILDWLFRRGDSPACVLAADVNDDQRINLLDAILLLRWLFEGPPEAPPGPWWRCGSDLTPGSLSCERGCED